MLTFVFPFFGDGGSYWNFSSSFMSLFRSIEKLKNFLQYYHLEARIAVLHICFFPVCL